MENGKIKAIRHSKVWLYDISSFLGYCMMVVRILTQEVDPEDPGWDFKIFGCNWQSGLRPLAIVLKEVTLSCKGLHEVKDQELRGQKQ